MSQEFEFLHRKKSMQDADWWRFNSVMTSFPYARLLLVEDKTKMAKSGGSIREAGENFSKHLKFSVQLRN